MISRIVEKLKTDRFYFDSIVLTVFTLLGNLVAFLVNIIYTRTLPPGQYGAVMSINSFINILTTISLAFRMFNVRETSNLIAKGQNSKAIVVSYKFTLYSFLGLVLFFLLLSPLYGYIIGFMKIDYLPFVMSIMIVIFSYLTSITSSLFQSLKLFLILGIISFSYPFLRFVFTYPHIVAWDGQYIGATSSMLLGIVVSFVLSSLVVILDKNSRELLLNENNNRLSLNLSYFLPLIPIVLINMLYSFLNFGDVIFSRRYFSDIETDIFALAATIAKANFFVITPISFVVLPRMIEDLYSRGYKASVMALVKGVVVALFASFVYLIFILIFGDVVLRIFGERYLEAKSILFLFTLAVIPIGISLLLINYSIVFKNWYFLIPLAVADIILIVGFIMFHSSFVEMILVDLVSGLVLLFSLSLMVLLSKDPKQVPKEDIIYGENAAYKLDFLLSESGNSQNQDK